MRSDQLSRILSERRAVAASLSVLDRTPDIEAVVNVADEGADMTGVGDSTMALKRARDKAAAKTLGGTVYVPDGDLRVTEEIVWEPNVNLIGSGRWTSRIRGDFTGSTKGVIAFTGSSFDNALTLRGLEVRAKAGLGYAVILGDATNVFAHNELSDLRLTFGDTACAFLQNTVSNLFSHVLAQDSSGHGFLIQEATGATNNDNLFIRCRAVGSDTGGVLIEDAVHQIFVECTFEGNGDVSGATYGIKSLNSNGVKLYYCWIESYNSATDGQREGVIFDGVLDAQTPTNGVVEGCTFRRQGRYAIWLTGSAEQVVVRDNSLGSVPFSGSTNVKIDSGCENNWFLVNTDNFDDPAGWDDAGTRTTIVFPSFRTYQRTPGARRVQPVITLVAGPPDRYDIDAFADSRIRAGTRLAVGEAQIFVNETTDPKTVKIRIYDNLERITTAHVFGIVRLVGTLSHSNAGNFDVEEKVFHFRHRIQGTSSIDVGTTAAYVSTATGQANESLALTVANWAQQGATQTGDATLHYVEFETTLNSGGRTSPIMGLYVRYELYHGN